MICSAVSAGLLALIVDYQMQLLFLDNCQKLQEDERQKGAGSA